MRWGPSLAACAVALLGCGRIGFDSVVALDGGAIGGAELGLSRPGDLVRCPFRLAALEADVLVAWTAFEPGTPVADVRFARLDSDGAALMGPLSVATAANDPAVVGVAAVGDEYRVFYVDGRVLTMLALDEAGQPSSERVLASGVEEAAATVLADGVFAVWTEDRLSWRFFDPAGEPSSSIGGVDARVEAVAVIDHPEGPIVAYGNRDTSDLEVVVAGTSLPVEGPLVFGPTVPESVSLARTGDSLLVAHDPTSRGRNLRYQFGAIGPLSTAGGLEEVVNRDADAQPAVASLAASEFAIAWVDDRAGLSTRISVAKVSEGGADPSPISLSSDSERSFCPGMVATDGGYTAGWLVERSSTIALEVTRVPAL